MTERPVPAAAGRLWSGRRGLALAALAGAAAGLGQVPFSLVPVALAGLAAACLACIAASGWRAAARTGWAVGTGYFAATLNWIVEPFLIDLPRHGWMAPFALLFIATGFGGFWAAAFAAAHRAGRGSAWRTALAWAAALALAEWLRSTVLTGFPWALVGYVWSEGHGAILGAVAGPFGLTGLTLILAAGIALTARRRPVAGAAALGAAWGLPLALGAALLAVTPQPPPGPKVTVRLVQPNAPQERKWDPDHAATYYERALAFTAAPGEPDLILWPETSVPYLLEPGHPAFARIAKAAGGATAIVGAQRLEGPLAFNSLAVLDPGGGIAQLYDKHHLVPFGEYVPLGGLASRLGLRGFAAREGFGYSAGPGPRLLDLGRAGTALPLICYEAIFPRGVANAPARPGWLLQITNDAWFGTFSGPYQHLAQARMRTIEQGLPMVRVANTGVSAVIDARGRIAASLPLGEAGFLDHALPPAMPPTPYARWGDLPALGALLLALGIVFAGARTVRD